MVATAAACASAPEANQEIGPDPGASRDLGIFRVSDDPSVELSLQCSDNSTFGISIREDHTNSIR
jgi:hypothetical protein